MPRKSTNLPRRSLFDSMSHVGKAKNLYCEKTTLVNEAAVEHFFVAPLLRDLGYANRQIKTKQSISSLTVSLGGSKSIKYKPDYVLTFRGKPKWLFDAKSPEEDIENWIPQCSGYCLRINQQFPEENPVQHFMLSNGLKTSVYAWDHSESLIDLEFADFEHGNPKYEQLKKLLGADAISSSKKANETDDAMFRIARPSAQVAKQLFSQCHKVIWKSEGCSLRIGARR